MLCAKDVMSADVVWITAQHTLNEAFATMTQFNIDHLPVVENQIVIGMISKKELFHHTIDHPDATRACVGDAMQRNIYTCPLHSAVSNVAQTMLQFRLNAVPVLNRNELVGIITATDILGCAFATKAQIA